MSSEIMQPGKIDHSGRYSIAWAPAIKAEYERRLAAGETAGINEWLRDKHNRAIYLYRPLPQAVRFHQSTKRMRFALGGNRCLGPETLIESPDGPARRVCDIKGPHTVWAWDGTKRVPALAGEPFVKRWAITYRVTLKSGKQFDCSAEHRVLTCCGYHEVSEIFRRQNSPTSYGRRERFLIKRTYSDQPTPIRSILEIPQTPGYKIPYEFGCGDGLHAAGRQGPIYDFEVPKYHNYCLAGIVHHNSSKSESLAMECAWYLTGTHPWKRVEVPCVGWYCTVTWEMVGTILWEKLKRMLAGFPYRVVWHNRQFDRPARVYVKVKGGESVVIFKSYQEGSENFQGTERRFIFNDEQMPQNIFVEQVSRVGSLGPLDWVLAATPIKPQPWLEERLVEDLPDDWGVFNYPLDDNRKSAGGFVEDSEIDSMIGEWPEEVVETRRHGKWGSYLGQVYKTFSRDIHVVQEKDEPLFFPNGGIPHPNWPSIISIDWGFGSAPFGTLFAVKIPHFDTTYFFDEYYYDSEKKGVRLVKEHTKVILEMKDRWKTTIGKAYADPEDLNSRNEMAAAGISTTPAKKDIIAGIEQMQSGFRVREATRRPKIHIAARCKNFIRELGTYRYPEATATKDSKGIPVDKENHLCDCGRYTIYSEFRAEPSKVIILGGSNARKF